MKNIIIIANGNFPSHPIPYSILKEANTIICCDGAANELLNKGIEPNHIIGDMDSIDKNITKLYKHKIIKLINQNENDLRKAIDWAEKKQFKKATLLGLAGKRDDHCIGNIFTLLQFPTKLELKSYTNYGLFSIVNDKKIFNSFKDEQVSLFAIDSSIKISTSGLKYNLNNQNINTLYHGTLNNSINKCFTVKISHGKVLVYQAFTCS